jgi:hypothetical protein
MKMTFKQIVSGLLVSSVFLISGYAEVNTPINNYSADINNIVHLDSATIV